jgi:hypothetical protein
MEHLSFQLERLLHAPPSDLASNPFFLFFHSFLVAHLLYAGCWLFRKKFGLTNQISLELGLLSETRIFDL